jgi:hypothetical protein
VFGQALRRGRTARVYAEAQPVPCDRSEAGAYQVKHNPWPYFVDERAACLERQRLGRRGQLVARQRRRQPTPALAAVARAETVRQTVPAS